MHVWVLVAKSCEECNKLCVHVLDHAPTKADEDSVAEGAGGMFCIEVRTVETDIIAATPEP